MGATRSTNLHGRYSEAPAGEGHLGSGSCHGNRKTGALNENGLRKNKDIVMVLRTVERKQPKKTVMFRMGTSIFADLASKPFCTGGEPLPTACFLMEGRAHIF